MNISYFTLDEVKVIICSLLTRFVLSLHISYVAYYVFSLTVNTLLKITYVLLLTIINVLSLNYNVYVFKQCFPPVYYDLKKKYVNFLTLKSVKILILKTSLENQF